MSHITRLIQKYEHRAVLYSLVHMAELITTLAQTLIVSFGVPLVLMLLLVVEHSRVMHGIALFEADHSLAWLAALSLVLVNFTLEFLVHYIEHRAGYVPDRARRASLRLLWRSLSYWLGISRHWQEQELSPADRYRRLLRLVTFTILALALAGSMRGAINQQTGAWYDGLAAVITRSTLAEMSTWAGGLLFALAAVAGAQNLTAYLAVRAAEVIEKMDSEVGSQVIALEEMKASDEDTAEVVVPYVEVSETDRPLPVKKNGRNPH